ncbi:GspE/PulE family protein [Desnuesiella massiliensis]|uniref:GspE/PulE family protein n=1 Tax=Desnuesiella massiliensis TaxID=1650662 RepID=UPI0006E29DA3|nr:GspE/PulE family protein [Desnuesiella massiliensis]
MENLNLLQKEIISKFKLFPFKKDNNNIYVAMTEKHSKLDIEKLRMIYNSNIIPMIVSEDKLSRLISEHSGKDTSLSEDIHFALNSYDLLIKNAVNLKATDIHIEPFNDSALIRLRIDGDLSDYKNLELNEYTNLCSKIKYMAGMDITEKRLPQDGQIIYSLDNKKYDLRISSIPTINGEKLALRILYKDYKINNMIELGFSTNQVELLKNILNSSNGLIIIAGPTGSGKTTTMYSLINELDISKLNISTIEDPVEYKINGINQININMKAGLTFSAGLRSVLRQDPDVVIIGEIRDRDTAEIAIRASVTGHKILSTIHTNDAMGVILRLMDLGIDRHLIVEALTGIVCQRLVKKLCNNCKVTYNANKEEKQLLYLPEAQNLVLYKPKGCIYCNGSGYSGRTSINEVIHFNSKIKEILIEGEGIYKIREQLKVFLDNSIVSCCKKLVVSGTTSLEEYIKYKNQIYGEI